MKGVEVRDQSEIISELSTIDAICRAANLAPVEVADLQQRVEGVLDWMDETASSIESDVALQLLDFLRMFSEARNFASLFSSPYAAYRIAINTAFFVQQGWREAAAMAENKSHLKRAIAVLRDVGEFSRPPAKEAQLSFNLVRHCLHLAASCSQFGLHTKALKAGRRSLQQLGRLTSALEAMMAEENHHLKAMIDHIRGLQVAVERLLASFELGDAERIAPTVLAELERLAPPLVRKLVPEWLGDVSIATFTHIDYITRSKAEHQPSEAEFMAEEFEALLGLTTSTLLFMLATENRFVCMEQFAAGAAGFRIRAVFVHTHQQRLRRMKRFVFSERLHAQAVRLLQAFFPPNALLAHLLASFEKNYQISQRLEHIPEVDEGSFATPRNGLLASLHDSGTEYSFENGKTRARVIQGLRASPTVEGAVLGFAGQGDIYIFESLNSRNNIYLNYGPGRRERAVPQTDRKRDKGVRIGSLTQRQPTVRPGMRATDPANRKGRKDFEAAQSVRSAGANLMPAATKQRKSKEEVREMIHQLCTKKPGLKQPRLPPNPTTLASIKTMIGQLKAKIAGAKPPSSTVPKPRQVQPQLRRQASQVSLQSVKTVSLRALSRKSLVPRRSALGVDRLVKQLKGRAHI